MRITQKGIIVLVSFLAILSFSALISPCYATDYEFLQNKGFEDTIGGNLITTGNMESGFTDGLNSRNSAVMISTKYHSPTNSLGVSGAQKGCWYNFTTPIPVGNVASLGCYVNDSSASWNSDLYLQVVYTDLTMDQVNQDIGSANGTGFWRVLNWLLFIDLDEGKSISAVGVVYSTAQINVDDMYLTTTILGQTTVTQYTKPWYINGYADSILQLNGINTNASLAHSGNCSYKDSYGYLVTTLLGGTSTTSSFPLPVYQDLITGVYTDNVTEFSLWVMSDSEYVYQITAFFIYSDGFLGQKQLSFSSYNQWSLLDFTSGILPNKILTKIGFQMTGGHIAANTGDHEGHYYLYIDDVSLITNVPLTQTTITWTMRPYPLSWNTQGFTQLTGVAESFTYYIYNIGGGLNENGTAIITTSYGTVNTTVNLGTFSFSISARPSGSNITEFITSQIILENRTIVHTLDANWVTLPQQTPTTTHGITDDTVQQGTDTVAYLGGGLIITLALTLTFGAVAGKDGLLSGLGVGIFLSSIAGLFPIYGLIISILVFAVLVVSHTGIPNSGVNT